MGLPKIGAVLALDGEREYKSALTSINAAQRVLRSEMKLATEVFYGQENSIEALTQKQGMLERQQEAQIKKTELCQAAADKYAQAQEAAGKKVEEAGEMVRYAQERLERLKNTSESTSDEIQRQEKVVQQAKAQLETANRQYETASKKNAEWEMSLNTANAELMKTNRALDENEAYLKEAMAAADGHAKSIDEFGKKVKGAEEESCKFNDVWSQYGQELVSLQKLQMTVSVLKQVGNAAMNAARDAAAYADDVLTMATNTGVAADTLQELKYAQDLMDVSLETVTGSMAKNIRSMKSAREGAAAYEEAYKKLGVAVEDVTTGELRDSETVFWECIDALKKMENETERDAVAMQIFGRSAQDLNSLVAQGSEGFAQLAEEAHKTGYVLSEETLSSMGDMQNAMDRFSNQSTKVKNKIGAELAPTVTKALDSIGSKSDELIELAVNAGESVLPAISDALGFLIEQGEVLIPVLVSGAAAIKAYKLASEAAKAIDDFRDATEGATVAQSIMNTVANANPYVLLATAVVAVGTAVAAYCVLADDATEGTAVWKKEVEELTERTREFNETSKENKAERENVRKNLGAETIVCQNLVKELEKLQAKTSLTSAEQARQRMIVDELNQAIPELNLAINEQNGSLNQTTEELYKNVDAMMALARAEAAREHLTEIAKEQFEAEMNLAELTTKLEERTDAAAEAQERFNRAQQEWEDSEYAAKYRSDVMETATALGEAQKAQKDLEEQVESTKETLTGFAEEYESVKKYLEGNTAIAEASGAVQELGTSAEGTEEQISALAEQTKQAFSEMGDSIRQSVEEQIDIFSEYEKQNAISGEKLIKNMESQVEGIQNWGDNLNELAGKADENGTLISEGLLKHLVDLGPEGAVYVQSFATMTDEELRKANELWEKSITLPDTIAEKFVETGARMAEGLTTGIQENAPAVEEAMSETVKGTVEAGNAEAEVNSPSKKTMKTGRALDEGLAAGIKNNRGMVLTAMKETTAGVLTTARIELSSEVSQTIGRQFSEGLALGIRSGKSGIIKAAVDVAKAAITAAKSELQINSPSKATEQMGEYYMDGWIQGIRAKTENLKDAVRGSLSDALIKDAVPANAAAEGMGSLSAGNTAGDTHIQIYFQPQQMTEQELDRAFEYVNVRFGAAL